MRGMCTVYDNMCYVKYEAGVCRVADHDCAMWKTLEIYLGLCHVDNCVQRLSNFMGAGGGRGEGGTLIISYTRSN